MDPIKSWIKTGPVRRWMGQAAGAWGRNHGWRKVGIATLIIILICVFLVTATIVLLVFLLKGLSPGKVRNLDLYLPGKFQNRDLYIPKGRR